MSKIYEYEDLKSFEVDYSYSVQNIKDIENIDNGIGFSSILFKINEGKFKDIVFSADKFDEVKLENEGILSYQPIYYDTDDEVLIKYINEDNEELKGQVAYIVENFLNYAILKFMDMKENNDR